MQTVRQRMIDLLSKREMSARELSQEIGIREKEVYDHLSHITRSAAAQRKKLIIQPCRCLVCGYVFENRKRFTPPGRCPRCKKSHLQRPMYWVS
ncbi:transcriptional regulator [Candidatus Aerophobetes bacterium]|uniref:Transcriptional regulator n=1 Tax=Aerophobetes bacterium TaxID=2030807 RepID=A0A523RZJ0_UNCAE|nr:MAG: transcriptional regulator [Candidatus Aerophobetes bacterium]